ncbi:MAG: ATP-binding cassette domain-containing protein [Chloroflexi bacterium]|nr:ATP-binding cassette domain-containing protein [Chloroflexota bacterium]
MPVVEFQGVSKTFTTRSGESIEALRDVDLSVQPGELLTIVGVSGCGKSTLLRLVAGLVQPTSGRLLYEGEERTGARDDLGVVFQESVLFPWRTVLDNALVPAVIKRARRAEVEPRVRQLLADVGLSGFEKKYPFELSGGMKQRTALVAALSTEPSVLLMDEPFGALDAMTREQMNVDLRRLWQERSNTIILITHDVAEAVFLGTRALVMTPRPGRIKADMEIDLGAERDISLLGTAEFATLTGKVRRELDMN